MFVENMHVILLWYCRNETERKSKNAISVFFLTPVVTAKVATFIKIRVKKCGSDECGRERERNGNDSKASRCDVTQ